MRETCTVQELHAATGIPERTLLDRLKGCKYVCFRENRRGKPAKHHEIDDLPEELRLSLMIHRRKRLEQEQETLSSASQIQALQYQEKALAVKPYSVKTGAGFSNEEKQEALAKGRLVQNYRQFLSRHGSEWGQKGKAEDDFVFAFNHGAIYPDLLQLVGRVKLSTIRGWDARLRDNNDDPFSLIDRRGKHRKGCTTLTDDQVQVMKPIALMPNRLPDSEIIRLFRVRARELGIPTPQHDNTFRNYLKDYRKFNYAEWLFYREGWKALNEKCLYHIDRDYSQIEVGDILFADGHRLNTGLIYPFTGREKRMTQIAWYDMKSNYLCGWEVMATENTDAITSALYRAILCLGKIPKVLYLDNGKAFRSKFFSGIKDFREAPFVGLFERLGCKVIFAWLYHPESKPVEGFFKIMGELERRSPAYTGSSIETKPAWRKRGEKLHRKLHEAITQGRVPTIEEFHTALATWLDTEYSVRPQRGHLKGRSPLEVFREGKGPGFTPEEEEKLRILMMKHEPKRITRDGVKMPWCDEHYYHPDLFGRNLQRVFVRFDWFDKSKIYVYDEHDNFICEAHPKTKVHPAAYYLGTEEDQDELKRQIALKQRLAKQVTGPARRFLQSHIMPEVKRQQEQLGFSDGAEPLSNLPKLRKPEPEPWNRAIEITPEEDARIQQEVAEREAAMDRAEEPYSDEWRQADPDSQRYESLLEKFMLKVEPLTHDDRKFIRFFERTPGYQKHKDYYDERRLHFGMRCGKDDREE